MVWFRGGGGGGEGGNFRLPSRGFSQELYLGGFISAVYSTSINLTPQVTVSFLLIPLKMVLSTHQ